MLGLLPALTQEKISLDRWADSFLPTQRTKSSKASRRDLSSRGKACAPYWTESMRAWSVKLSLCKKTDCLALPQTSWNTSLERLASNSWFTVQTKTLKDPPNSLRTSSLSQPCLSQVIMENEARKTADLQAKSKVRKKAKLEQGQSGDKQKKEDQNGTERPKKTYENPMRARRIRVHPTPDQEQVILGWFGTCRFVYNQGVEATQDSTEKVNMATLRVRIKSDEMLTQHPWLADTPEDVRSGALRDFIKAQSTHFAKLRKLRDVDQVSRTSVVRNPGIPVDTRCSGMQWGLHR